MSKISSLLRWLSLSLVTLGLAVACTQQPKVSQPNASNSPSSVSAPLVSGDISWVGFAGNYVALKKGFFEQEGLNVQNKFFANSSDQITALLAGKLDIAWLSSGDALQAAVKDPSLKMIYLLDYSDGADGIIGRNIAAPKDAKGKSVARENLLFVKVLLQAYLKQGGLTLDFGHF
jgi:NitT/TauT family transport system substrate-binding protein